MHPQGSDLHRVAPVRGGGDPAGPGSSSARTPRALHPLLPLSNSAPSAANCAAHRRGYPRALTGSNPGAGGGGGGGGHCARAAARTFPAGTCRVRTCPARAWPGRHLRALRAPAVVLSNHSAFGVPNEHESPPDSLHETRSQIYI